MVEINKLTSATPGRHLTASSSSSFDTNAYSSYQIIIALHSDSFEGDRDCTNWWHSTEAPFYSARPLAAIAAEEQRFFLPTVHFPTILPIMTGWGDRIRVQNLTVKVQPYQRRGTIWITGQLTCGVQCSGSQISPLLSKTSTCPALRSTKF